MTLNNGGFPNPANTSPKVGAMQQPRAKPGVIRFTTPPGQSTRLQKTTYKTMAGTFKKTHLAKALKQGIATS